MVGACVLLTAVKLVYVNISDGSDETKKVTPDLGDGAVADGVIAKGVYVDQHNTNGHTNGYGDSNYYGNYDQAEDAYNGEKKKKKRRKSRALDDDISDKI